MSRIAGALYHVSGKNAPKVHLKCTKSARTVSVQLHRNCTKTVPPLSATLSLLLCVCMCACGCFCACARVSASSVCDVVTASVRLQFVSVLKCSSATV
eukprot:519263-Pyramimonas_sp.AAC.1